MTDPVSGPAKTAKTDAVLVGAGIIERHPGCRPWLLFGPFAGWSSKFLKHGRVSDLPRSVEPNNLLSLVNAGGIGHA
jgi:hypothetical protein